MKGVSAVIAVILMLVITIALAGSAWLFISGIFTAKTGIIIEIDGSRTSCSGTSITTYVRNSGTIQTTADKVTVIGTNSQGGDTVPASVTCGAATTTIASGGASVACASVTGTQGTNRIVVTGPSNTVSGTVYCS